MSDLFDFIPAARASDPESSHEAVVALAGARASNTQAVIDLVKANPGKTYAELAALIGWDKHRVEKRLNDGKKLGQLRVGPRRKCSVAAAEGRNQSGQTWWPVGGGSRA